MATILCPDEEESYLFAILTDPSGLDQAEFAWHDPENLETGCYRAWDFQIVWYRCLDPFQVDQGGRALGKRLAVDTPIATPSGWTTMGELRVGAQVFDERGVPCTVLETHPITVDVDAREVEFSDGSIIVADAEHLWLTRDKASRRADARGTSLRSRKVEERRTRAVKLRTGGATLQQIADELGYSDKSGVAVALRDATKPTVGAKPAVRSTAEIQATLRHGVETNHSVDVTAPLQLIARDLPIEPYLLGVWLGDGDKCCPYLTLGPKKAGVVDELRKRGHVLTEMIVSPGKAARWRVEGLRPHLRQLDLLEHKHIPMSYLRASEGQRRDVLAGLFDTDGYLDPCSLAEWKFMNDPLAQDALDLVLGLGEKAVLHTGQATINGIEKGEFQRITWNARHDPSLRRSAHPYQELGGGSLQRVSQRRITAVRSVSAVPMRCISVDSPSHLYLAGRTLIPTHNSVGITMRAFAFPFLYEGQSMLLTAPELNHLRPLTFAIEKRLDATRLIREMRPKTKGGGITKAPHWQCVFNNGASIVSRLPNKDGRGVKGMHVIQIELDEAQDYPLAGWNEVGPTLNRGLPGAGWKCHGVPKGTRDRFYDISEGQKGDGEHQWTVHRPMGFMRPTWSAGERQSYIDEYRSRQNIDYKRNIYGEHGDSSNAVFVLAKLMNCVDTDDGSLYNSEVYTQYHIEFENLPKTTDLEPKEADFVRQEALRSMITIPNSHIDGWSYLRGKREMGSPTGYSSYWGGMDIGGTNHPSEILVFGQRKTSEQLDLLLRVHMQRIAIDDQDAVVEHVLTLYQNKIKAFGIDSTGLGFQIADHMHRYHPTVCHGYNFSKKYVVGFEDRQLEEGETKADLAIERNVVEAATDWLRNDWVDPHKMLLPFDGELLQEFQGQTYSIVKDDRNPYLTRRMYGGGSFHTLDSAKLVMAARYIPPLEAVLNETPEQPPILDYFVNQGF